MMQIQIDQRRDNSLPVSARFTSVRRPVYGCGLVDVDLAKCERCGLLVFDGPETAAAAGIPFSRHINLRSGRLCIGCAGGDQVRVSQIRQPINSAFEALSLRPPQTTEVLEMPRGKKQTTEETTTTQIFTAFEVGVSAPSGRYPGKYDELESAVLSVPLNGRGKSDWMRFAMPGKRQAQLAQSHLRKRSNEEWKTEGHNVQTRVVSQDDGTAWLYVQRKTHQAEE